VTSDIKFMLGTHFIPRSDKAHCIYTVIDVWRTFNWRGDIVRIEYVAEHSLAGQRIESHECETTIAMGIENMERIEKDLSIINARQVRPKGIRGS